MRCAVSVCLACLLLAAGTGAAQMPAFPAYHLLHLAPYAAGAAPKPGQGEVPVLLTLPPFWSSGDAVALLLAGSGGAPALDRLSGSLLHEETAVLRILPHQFAGQDCIAVALNLISSASRILRRDYGPGLMLAIGSGCGGRAARLAAAELPESGLAAAVELEPDGARFMRGIVPSPEERWPERFPILCALLDDLHGHALEVAADCMQRFGLPSAATTQRTR